jgi:hypothetical protein
MAIGRPAHEQLMQAPNARPPTVRIDATTDQELVCDVEECAMVPELKITFVGQVTAPHLRCLGHWATARAILTDAGYAFDFSPQALYCLMPGGDDG